MTIKGSKVLISLASTKNPKSASLSMGGFTRPTEISLVGSSFRESGSLISLWDLIHFLKWMSKS